jgi:hypothetical protein
VVRPGELVAPRGVRRMKAEEVLALVLGAIGALIYMQIVHAGFL